MMMNIAVFCGSSAGDKEIYGASARKLAECMVEKGIGMVNGAGNIGLMGVMADEMLRRGGRVTGVIPGFLVEREVCHTGLTQLHVVDSMSERKELIGKLSDGFIALPGGFGTLDELAEVLTWFQLGITKKPIGLLNVNGYWDSLIALFDRMLDDKFIRKEHRANICIAEEPEILLDALLNFRAMVVDGKWIENLKQQGRF